MVQAVLSESEKAREEKSAAMVRRVYACTYCSKRFVSSSTTEIECSTCRPRSTLLLQTTLTSLLHSSPKPVTNGKVLINLSTPSSAIPKSNVPSATPPLDLSLKAKLENAFPPPPSRDWGDADNNEEHGISIAVMAATGPAVAPSDWPSFEDDDDEWNMTLANLGMEAPSPPPPPHNAKKSVPVDNTTTTAAAATTTTTYDCIDLLSDDDENISEDDDDDEPILVDFQQPNEDGIVDSDNEDVASARDMDGPDSFLQEQQKLHSAGLKSAMDVPMTVDGATYDDNKDLRTCLACGADLLHMASGYKGRLNHIKRCTKKLAYTARDVRLDDSHELFADPPDAGARSTVAPPANGANPYLRKNHWHGPMDATLSASTTTNTLDVVPPNVATEARETTQSNGSAPRSASDMLMAGARAAAKRQKVEQQQEQVQPKKQWGKRQPRHPNAASSDRSRWSCPSFKKIPGTDFCCDGFQYAQSAQTRNFFLTHFHADHYGGITKGWNEGIIYCSIPTANLVHQQLGVARQYLHPLPMNTRTTMTSLGRPVTVTLLPANHCPGAVMFLFEADKRVILHVGDFRWNYQIMSRQALLRPYCRVPWTSGSEHEQQRRRIDDLFLDTTYCDARYSLPSQADCIKAVVDMALKEVERAKATKSRLLMLFGAYTIGKEIVYMSVAKKLGLPVYVDKRRQAVLSCLDWPKEDLSILTTSPERTIVWVVPLGHVNMKKMVSYQAIRTKGFSRDYDRVVGFRPTGWSMTSSKKGKDGIIGTTTKGNLTVHSVPYSEHSSFPELVECLESLNPRRIVPTVDVAKSQQQINLLMKHWRERQSESIL
jgi:DNA cross-link repair 1A protein